jgi:hypothetical protein
MITLPPSKRPRRRLSKMNLQQTEDLLQEVEAKVKDNSDSIFYLYTGQIYSEDDVLCRLDTSYVYVLQTYDDEVLWQRTFPCKDLNKQKELHATFTASPVFKVANGRRKGRYMENATLFDTEKADVVNMPKLLKLGQGNDGINLVNAMDRAFVEFLQDLLRETTIVSEPVYPELYCCSTKEPADLYLRDNPQAKQFLQTCKDYDPSMSLLVNLDYLSNRFGIHAGANRTAYSFIHMYGKGVVAVSMDNFGKWFCSKKSSFPYKQSHVYVNFVLPKV